VLRMGILVLALCAFAAVAALKPDLLPSNLRSILSRPEAKQSPTSSQNAGAPVRVKVARVRTEDVPIYLSGIGTVQAYNTINVTTRVDGAITQILFQEGQDVKAGDPLAIVDPRPYQAQLDQQIAIQLKDQALLDEAILDFKRYEELAKTSAVTRQQYEDQQYLVQQDRAQVKFDEAQVAYAKTLVDYTTIRSPVDGRTGIRQVDAGNNVYAALNSTIVVVTQLRPISVILTLAAAAVAEARLTLGQTHIPVIAYAADFKTELDRGTIDLVDNLVDPTTAMIKLKASFPNTALRLWPGNFVNAKLVVDTRRQGLTVVASALRHGPNGDYVWVVRNDNTVQAQAVQVRQSADGRVLVDRLLRPGQLVVTEGHFLLENGRRVEFTEPAEPAAATTAPKAESQSEADAE
jgi:membrane fusion protein, multidrug efflux system